jgi:AraC-like DNA-binding protein
MQYQIYDPQPDLQYLVKCFWTLEMEAQTTASKQRILPDGCMEMIFHFGDPYRQYFDDGTSILQPRSFVFGQISRYIEIEPTGVSGIISARFLPEGLAPFLSVPVNSLENKAVSMSTLFGQAGSQLELKIIQARTNRDRIQLVERFLLSILSKPVVAAGITRSCVEVIMAAQGQVGIADLAHKMKLNRRQLERKFESEIGMTPKQFSRAIRLQATIKKLGEKNFSNLTTLAYENGYYDQAHFIRDFRDFTGMSPRSFFSGNMQLAALFASAE